MEKNSCRIDQFYHNVFMDSTSKELVTNTAKLPLETVKRLIAAVAKRPSLWERNYGNNGKRRHEQNMLWHEISAEVKLPVEICRSKWGHLRDNFRKVFIRNTLSGETPTSWRFYNDMRFMEKSLSYSILRQSHMKYQHRNFQEPAVNNFESSPVYGQSVNYLLVPGYNFNMEPALEQNLDNSSANSESYCNEIPPFKRIKLEPQNNEPQNEIQKYNCQELSMSTTNSHVPSRNEYADSEDVIVTNKPIEMCYKESVSIPNKAKSQIFTIEVFDNELEDTDNRRSFKIDEFYHNKSINSETNCDTSKELNSLDDDTDTDRLFLLSLLPYLQRISLDRKLHVRQKLQSVLIDEFV